MKKSQQLESELNSLSKKAKSLITPPQLDITAVLSHRDNSNISTGSFAKIIAGLSTNPFFKPAISFAAIVLCVLSILYWPGSQQNINQDSLTTGLSETGASETRSFTDTVLNEIDKDIEFAETINKLEDYALSGFITSSYNQNYNLEEFIEFVTPVTEEAI